MQISKKINGKFEKSIANEVVVVLENNAFKMVWRQELEDNANILGGCFVLVIQNNGSHREVFKDRYEVQRHMYRENYMLFDSSSTVIQKDGRLLLSISIICRYHIWSEWRFETSISRGSGSHSTEIVQSRLFWIPTERRWVAATSPSSLWFGGFQALFAWNDFTESQVRLREVYYRKRHISALQAYPKNLSETDRNPGR